jgi:hypothetical protein
MRQVKVVKKKVEGGRSVPAVQCVSCDAIVSPVKNPIMDGHDCPECDHIFQEEEMHAYAAAVAEARAAADEEDFEDGF